MSPLDGELDPKYGPKPVDQRKLAGIDASPADPTEKAYGRARTFFEAQHWVEAAIGFRAIAMDHPELDLGVYASQLYLEALNVIGAQAHRDACYVDMAQDVPTFRELYCTTRRNTNAEQCTTLDRLQFDIQRLQAEHAVQSSDRNPVDTSGYRAGAGQYLLLLNTYCTPISTVEHCDEVGYNGAMAFLAAGDTAGAQSIRAIMADPKNKLNKSPLTKRLICRLDGSGSPSCH